MRSFEKLLYTLYIIISGALYTIIIYNFLFAACTCMINGKLYNYGETIYNTSDGLGNCITAECGANGNISRTVYECLESTTAGPTTSPFTFSTAQETTEGKKKLHCLQLSR